MSRKSSASDNAAGRNLITGGTFNAPVIQRDDDDTRGPANIITGGTFNAPVVQQGRRSGSAGEAA